MSIKDEDDVQKAGWGSSADDSYNQLGLGEQLRRKREEKGLSRDQIAQITRLRVHFVEALEREDWKNLPASVFVKGFIKSYAKAVDMDARKILDLYIRNVPIKEEIPIPLVVPKRAKKQGLYLIIPIVIVIAGYYFWTNNREKSAIPSITSNQTGQIESHQPAEQEKSEPSSIVPPVWKGELRLVEEEASVGDSAAIEERFILKCTVSQRTWVEIYIDHQLPEEYLFEPGETYTWKAGEGFDILVGNASGIEFDFNGQKIGGLGEFGQVVRVKLPENFKSEIREE